MIAAFTTASSILHYVALCFIGVLAGMGVLRLLRVHLPAHHLFALAPLVAGAVWALFLGIGVTLRIPVQALAYPLWAITGLLGLLGLIAARWVLAVRSPASAPVEPGAGRITWRRAVLGHPFASVWLLVLCMVLPVVALLPHFTGGLADYPGSSMPDGWAYTAYGQYLWQYPRGAEGNLALLYQYGAGLSETRYTGSAFLGFLSPFYAAGDIQQARSLLLSWSLFAFASSCACFGLARQLRKSWLCMFLLLAVCSGWIYNIVWANNYDNLLALAYFPVLACSVPLLGLRGRASWVLPGCLAAAVVYCYPEFAFIMLGCAGLIAIENIWHKRRSPAEWRPFLGYNLLAMVVLLLVFVPTMNSFVAGQVAVGMASGPRPADSLFPGLLAPEFQPSAFWGLGGEYKLELAPALRNILGACLSALAGVGLACLVRQRSWGLAATAVLLLLASGYMLVVQRYGYGAYKFIGLAWWLLAFLVVLGMRAVVGYAASATLRRVVYGACIAVLTAVLLVSRSGLTVPLTTKSEYAKLSLAAFRQLDQIKALVGDANVLVVADDWLANSWAVYYLRDQRIALNEYRMYMAMAHVVPYMERAYSVAPQSAAYVLTDVGNYRAFTPAFGWASVWSGGPYQLWRPAEAQWALIRSVSNPNGTTRQDGRLFFWMSQSDTEIRLLASTAGVLELSGTYLIGPSVPGLKRISALLTTDAGYQVTITISPGLQRIRLPVLAGTTTVRLRTLDAPTRSTHGDGDTRPLVLGMSGIAVRLLDSAAQ
jgi:hypothetical protein